MRGQVEEPSTERRCAQVRQSLKHLTCEHPACAVKLYYLTGGGFVEVCVDCMMVLDWKEA